MGKVFPHMWKEKGLGREEERRSVRGRQEEIKEMKRGWKVRSRVGRFRKSAGSGEGGNGI